MSFVGLLVEKPGPLSLIQDFGRFGLSTHRYHSKWPSR